MAELQGGDWPTRAIWRRRSKPRAGLQSGLNVIVSTESDNRVALAVGSRGLANLPELVRLLAAAVRRLGAEPFVVPAMGSHGGATVAGQTEFLLAKMGVTEAAVRAPIRSSMEVVALGDAAPRSARVL